MMSLHELLPNIMHSLELDDPSSVCALQSSVASLRRAFRSDVPRVDYRDAEIAKAYMVAYFPYYATPVYRVLRSLPPDISKAVFRKSSVEACIFGCGPAPEALGLSSFINENFGSVQSIRLNLHDRNITSWRPFLDLTISRLSKPHWSGSLIPNKLECDLLRGCGQCASSTCRANRRTAGVYVFQNCLNDVGCDLERASDKLAHLLQSARPGALFVLVNVKSDAARRLIAGLESYAYSSGVGRVVNPVANSLVSAPAGFSLPELLKEHLFVGSDGLIAKTSVRYISSVITRLAA